MRAIDADKVIEFCKEWEKHFDFRNILKIPSFMSGIWTVQEYVESLPEVSAEKVGTWKQRPYLCEVECSNCGDIVDSSYRMFNYCPNCGAKMCGDKNESNRC